jgi:hypothetical protein
MVRTALGHSSAGASRAQPVGAAGGPWQG